MSESRLTFRVGDEIELAPPFNKTLIIGVLGSRGGTVDFLGPPICAVGLISHEPIPPIYVSIVAIGNANTGELHVVNFRSQAGLPDVYGQFASLEDLVLSHHAQLAWVKALDPESWRAEAAEGYLQPYQYRSFGFDDDTGPKDLQVMPHKALAEDGRVLAKEVTRQ